MAKHLTLSIVIPAYNCAQYLPDAIESVLSQDIGFADNIQLVLVNDGSTDDTGVVCAAYHAEFPDNIVYINQENQGASAARLAGLQAVTGEIVNFLDADDTWSHDACSQAVKTLKEHPDVPFCAARHTFFGTRTAPHPLSYKYEEDRVVNLLEDWDYPHHSLSNAFVRREALKPEYFDHRLAVSEDFLVVNRILLDNPRYAIMGKPTYWYRKREEGNSAIDTSANTKTWYTDPPQLCYRALFEHSRTHYDKVLPFIQFAVMYDLQWRLRMYEIDVLTEAEAQEYRELVASLLAEIDDKIILSQRNMATELMIDTLAVKHGTTYTDIQDSMTVEEGRLCCTPPGATEPLGICTLRDTAKLRVDFITPREEGFFIEGWMSPVLPAGKVSMHTGDSRALLKPRPGQTRSSLFHKDYCALTGFELEAPNKSFAIDIDFDGMPIRPSLKANQFCPLTFAPFTYALVGDYLLKPGKRSNEVEVAPATNAGLLAAETALELSVPLGKGRRKALGLMKFRRYAFARRKRPGNRQIWLLSDRSHLAGDNGEALFGYLQEHPVEGVDAYFVLSKDSPDFERLSKMGPTIDFGSDEHVRMQLTASKIISSAADQYVFSRFGEFNYLFRDLNTAQFVFLQHGVTQNDLSGWLNRYSKNIKLLVASAERERAAFLENDAYGFDADTVVCTGFPRHDKLRDMDARIVTERRVLIAPTWRRNIAGEADPATGVHKENPLFESTPYFEFYNGLLNDPRLVEAFDRLGYRAGFLIHPALMQESHKFSSPIADVLTEYDYQTEFSRSQIMLTDYSSVAFDFALLGKPLIYAQFDYDDFYANHPWGHGYFDYREDGFGPVCSDLDSTVEALLAYLEDPTVEASYANRAEEFFYRPATSSCQEVVEAILRLDA